MIEGNSLVKSLIIAAHTCAASGWKLHASISPLSNLPLCRLSRANCGRRLTENNLLLKTDSYRINRQNSRLLTAVYRGLNCTSRWFVPHNCHISRGHEFDMGLSAFFAFRPSKLFSSVSSESDFMTLILLSVFLHHLSSRLAILVFSLT